MITNHSYLDNPTFRGMRQSLMRTFDDIYILDLHGNSLKKETCPDGSPDKNVFDIRQGVAIAFFVKRGSDRQNVMLLFTMPNDTEHVRASMTGWTPMTTVVPNGKI